MKKYLAIAIVLFLTTITTHAQVELVSSGTGSAYTLSIPGTFSLSSGLKITFKAHAAATAAATLNVSGSGAFSITKNGGSTALTAGDIIIGQVVTVVYDGSNWQMTTSSALPGSSGTVTSVGLTAPSEFSITGSPITSSGTFTLGWNPVSQNLVFASPNGAAGSPSFRALVANDIPNLNANKITAGILPLARGGTNASLAAVNGGIVYSTATAFAITPVGTSGQVLQSNGAAAPSWTTPSFLPSGTSGQTLRHDGTGWLANSLLYNDGTNIGIGTEYPANIFNILSVRATQTDTSGSSGAFIDMHNTANSLNAFSGFRFRGSYNTMPYIDEAYQAGIFFRRTDASNFGRGDLIFATKTTASYGNVHAINDAKMVIKYATGNVGIGTNAPSHKLHVEGGRLRVANGASNADLYQSGSNTLLETSGQFQIYANGSGPEFTIDDGNANFYVPLIIQDGTQANNRVLTSNAIGYATWTDLSAISSGSTAWTKSGSNIYPTTITDNVGIGTSSPTYRLQVENNVANQNVFLMRNETAGANSLISGTKGGVVTVTGSDNNQRTGLEVRVGGTGTSQQNGIFTTAEGTATAAYNRGIVASASNNSSSNYGGDFYALGNLGYNYGIRSTVGGTQNNDKYGVYINLSGSGTKNGIYSIGEDQNYFSNMVGIGVLPATKIDVANSTLVTTSRFVNTLNSATQKMAVYGWATGTGAGANLAGAFEATGSTSTNYGVQGSAYGNSGAKVAIYGSATGTGTNTAGYFTATGGTTNNAIVVPSGGGNVGIGTASPSQALEVVGNIEIPAANDYMYASAKTSYSSISPVAFIPESSTYYRNSVSGYIHLGGGTFPSTGEIHAPVYLPNGAIITEVRFYIYDNDATYDFVYLQLFRYTMSTGASTFSSATIPTGTFGISSYATTPNYTVDNSLYQYMLRIGMPQNSTNHRLYGVRITYTVTKAD